MAKKVLIGIVLLAIVVFGMVRMAANTPATVRVERTFKAPVAKVWEIWNDPEKIKLWWGPKDYTAPVAKNDLRLGGTYLLAMKSPKGEIYWNVGTYKNLIPQKLLVSELQFSDENGKAILGRDVKVPGNWPDAVTVKVDFSDDNGGTRVTVTEVGVPLLMKFFAGLGWNQQFDKLEKLL